MTNQEAIEMMKAKLECMTRDVSGTVQMCIRGRCDDCNLCYTQGNMDEQKEWLRMGIKALENQKIGHWEQYGYPWENKFKCSECGKEQPKILCGEEIIGHWSDYCPNCGAEMKGETNETDN